MSLSRCTGESSSAWAVLREILVKGRRQKRQADLEESKGPSGLVKQEFVYRLPTVLPFFQEPC